MEGRFNIRDQAYFEPLVLVTQQLDSYGHPYFLFGGGAVQVAIASALTKGEEDFRKNVRLENMLRRTGDIDICIDAEPAEIINCFQELMSQWAQQYHPSIQYGSMKFGKVLVNFCEKSALRGLQDHVDDMFNTAVSHKLKKGSSTCDIVIEIPEYIIAAKLTGNKVKRKDIQDISRMHDVLKEMGIPIDDEFVRGILVACGKEERFQVYQNIIEV